MKKTLITFSLIATCFFLKAQNKMALQDVFNAIDNSNPLAKMYAAQIRSADEAAKGARNWMPTEFGTGFWMTPYNTKLWRKGDNGATGMGQYMISAQQFFPNKNKQDAEASYLESISSVDKEKIKYELNQLYADAAKNYYNQIVIEKKLKIINENEKLLNFMRML